MLVRRTRQIVAQTLIFFLIGTFNSPAGFAAPTPADVNQEKQKPSECLVLPSVCRYGRSPIFQDALQEKIVTGNWIRPKAGDTIALPDGSTRKWESVTIDKDGWFAYKNLADGYAYFPVTVEKDQVVILEATGHGMVYVNGEPRTGDPYQTGYVDLPILLRKGTNDLLFHVGRGRLKVEWIAPKSPVQFNLGDMTLPDLSAGKEGEQCASVVVTNSTSETRADLTIEAEGLGMMVATPIPALLPLSSRKVGFSIKTRVAATEGNLEIRLRLVQKKGDQPETLDTARINLRVRRPEQTHKVTFISDIDGSVQYFAHVPARLDPAKATEVAKPAIVLTLHGAGVEALGQADCYAAKPWAHIVAPTNRRPFGFDWEDWGRLDALEVAGIAQKQLDADQRRTYLTGHSMGGHGTWHIGATFPDRFAAIGPSAGWISMWSYAGAKRTNQATPMEDMLQRGANPSDTLALARNYSHHGIYILHGDKDDNVPVEQARTMKKQLADFHKDFEYHEETGAGHWWGKATVSGAACVDWPAMFEFFEHHAIPKLEDIRQVEFTTANPGISARCHWVGIEAQVRSLKPSSVKISWDPKARRFAGTTDNVARLSLDLSRFETVASFQVQLDGQRIERIPWPEKEHRLWLEQENGKWCQIAKPSLNCKNPLRYGTFKDAFRNRVLFVFGTQGSPAENAWSQAKARYDAEVFWYRGNASVDVIPIPNCRQSRTTIAMSLSTAMPEPIRPGVCY